MIVCTVKILNQRDTNVYKYYSTLLGTCGTRYQFVMIKRINVMYCNRSRIVVFICHMNVPF